MKIPVRFDRVGGFFSGFMGGLIGNQGAIRSAYLLNYSLSKEEFIATGTAVSILIDVTRIPLYIGEAAGVSVTFFPLGLVITVAFAGTFIGKELVKKVSLQRFRLIVASFLIVVALRLFFL